MKVQVLFLILGAFIWKKVRIPDSVLLVHSKITTISDDNSDPNENGFTKILSPLPGIKNASLEGGGSHLWPLSVSTPQCFNVKTSPKIMRGLTQHLSPLLILLKQLLTQESQPRNQKRIRSSNWWVSPPPSQYCHPPQTKTTYRNLR